MILGFSAGSTRVRRAVEESLDGLSGAVDKAVAGQSSRFAEGVSSSLNNIRKALRNGESARGMLSAARLIELVNYCSFDAPSRASIAASMVFWTSFNTRIAAFKSLAGINTKLLSAGAGLSFKCEKSRR